ncbi:hypothetical protein Tco_0181985, partial [Tanacetum coccineum]
QGQIYPPQNNRPPTFQAPPYQAPAPAPAPAPSAPGSGSLPSNTIANPKGDVKQSLPEAVFPIIGLKFLLLLKRGEMNPR